MTIDSVLILSSSPDLKNANDVIDNIVSTVTIDSVIMEKVETKTEKSKKSGSDQSVKLMQVVDGLVSSNPTDKFATKEKIFCILKSTIQS